MVIKYINLNSKLKFKPSVACIGYFDGVHIGHQKLILDTISCAKKYNVSSTVICFTPDPVDIINNCHNKHISSFETRLSIFDSLGVDNVIVFRFNTEFMRISPNKFIKNYLNKMSIIKLICGYDFSFGYKGIGDYKLLEEKGNFELKVMPEFKYKGSKVSSTRIKESLSRGNIRLVNTLLGYNYYLIVKVNKTLKTGKKWLISLKTIDKNLLLPPNGAYSDGFEINSDNIYLIGSKPLKKGQVLLLEFNDE